MIDIFKNTIRKVAHNTHMILIKFDAAMGLINLQNTIKK